MLSGMKFKGPILYCFSSNSHSCQRSNNTVLEMHCPKPIRGPEFQLSKSRSSELCWEQAVSVPAPLNANELRLSMPALLLHCSLRERMLLTLAVAYVNVYGGCILWLAEMLSFNHTSLTQNWTPKERLLKKYRQLQQDVSQWLVSLKMLHSLFVCVVTVTTM